MLCSRSGNVALPDTASTARPNGLRLVRDDSFLEALRTKLDEWPHDGGYAVAFSGGADSTLLLTALARAGLGRSVRALHVDHGLHPDSALWTEQCAAAARALGVQYEAVRVEVDRDSPLGLEAAARTARYAALRNLLMDGETLLTAHHADDQLETVLLRVMRGAGARGLRGIVAHAPFGRGFLARPLLDFTRRELAAIAERWQLAWIEDPSNRNVAHDRNYLRHAVLPALLERWPAAPRMAQRLARALADAGEILDERAAEDALGLERPDRVPRARLLALTPSRRRNLLRYLLRQIGSSTPTERQLAELDHGLTVTRRDAQTRVAWPGGEARVYRDFVYLLPPLGPASPAGTRVLLRTGESWAGPEGLVSFVPTAGAGLPLSFLDAGVELRFRAGGERFRPLGRTHGTSLKRWLHDARIVPWMRSRLPLFFYGDRLVAVADLALDQAVDAADGAQRFAVSWTQHPPVT